MGIVDGHAHVKNDPQAVRRLIASLDSMEFAHCVVVGGGLVSPRQLAQGIRTAPTEEQAYERCFDNIGLLKTINAVIEPGTGSSSSTLPRLLPFYFANPSRPAEEYQAQGQQFYGLKLAPAVHGLTFSPPSRYRGNLIDYLRIAESFGHPVYTHCLDRKGVRVRDLCQLAKRFPAIDFILGHAGVGTADFEAVTTIQPHRNVFLETSGGFSQLIQDAIDRLGAERVLFGSEYPLQDPAVEKFKIERLALSPRQRDHVLGGTVKRLLARTPIARTLRATALTSEGATQEGDRAAMA